MNARDRLLKAFLDRELKGIFGDVMTSSYLTTPSINDNLVVIVDNFDRSRPVAKQLLRIAVSMRGNEIGEGKHVLDIFKLRASDAAECFRKYLKNEITPDK